MHKVVQVSYVVKLYRTHGSNNLNPAQQLLDELNSTEFPLYIIVSATNADGVRESVVEHVTTPDQRNIVIADGIPTGKTPLEAAYNTYNAICGQVQLQARFSNMTPREHLLEPRNADVIAVLLRLRALIAKLETAGSKPTQECQTWTPSTKMY